VILARLIPPEALGVYFLTQSLVIMASNIGEFGLNRPIVRMISADVAAGRVGAARRAVRSAVAISAISGFVVLVFVTAGPGRWLALHVFDSRPMADTVALIGLWVAGRIVLNIGSAALQGLHRVGLSALLSGALSASLLAGICGALLWRGTTVAYSTIIVIATSTTLAAALLCAALVWAPFSGIRAAGPSRTRALLANTLPIFAAGVLQVAAVQADLWIVGAQLDPADVALYGAAKRLATLVGFPVMVLSFVVPPLMSDLYARGERARLQRLLRAATTAASLPAVAGFGLFFLFPSEILALTYGEVYGQAAVLLRILCVERLVFTLLGPGSLLLVMTGHERAILRITIVSSALSLSAIYAGGHLAGLLGVAVAYALASGGTALWYFLEAHRQTGIWCHVNPFSISPMVEVVQRMIRGTR